MPRAPRAPATIPDEQGLKDGIVLALQMYVQEAGLRLAVGETGILRAGVEIFLDQGRAKHSKGSCYFERRMDLGGARG